MDRVLSWSLRRRVLVLFLAAIGLGWGGWTIWRMPVDVLPDLTSPVVAVMTDAAGLDVLEVERLVTVPLEAALNGSSGVRRIRSSSVSGFSVVWVEFDWGADILKARQSVSEKLQLAVSRFPPQASAPVLAPITSIMGEVMFVALQSDSHSEMAWRTLART